MKCRYCNKDDCPEHCNESPGGAHAPDPKSIAPAQGVEWIVDVNCVHCGRSGAVAIDPNAVDW